MVCVLLLSVQRPDNCVGPADIVIVVDGSDSITFLDESNWGKLLDFVTKLSQTLPLDKGTHVGLVQFATSYRVEFNLNRYFNARDIVDYVNQMSRIEGETNIALALNVMTNDVFGRVGDRPDVKDLAILITDGRHNVEGWNVTTQAKMAKDRGIELFTVGVHSRPPPDSFDLAELQMIASDPDFNHVFTAENFDELANVISRLTGPLCDAAGFITTTPGVPTLPPTTPKPIGKVHFIQLYLDKSPSCKIGNFCVNRTFHFCGRQAFAMSSNMASSGLRKMLA